MLACDVAGLWIGSKTGEALAGAATKLLVIIIVIAAGGFRLS
jgi:hypothetical protein